MTLRLSSILSTATGRSLLAVGTPLDIAITYRAPYRARTHKAAVRATLPPMSPHQMQDLPRELIDAFQRQFRRPFAIVFCLLCVACGGGSDDQESEPRPTGRISADVESCTIPVGEPHCTSTLSWETMDADTACVFTESGELLGLCRASGSLTANIHPGINTFLLKAGSNFEVSRMLGSEEVEGINEPWVDVFFDPSSIMVGEGSNLNWASEHTESCSGVPDSDTELTMGSHWYVRNEPGDWAVEITCKGRGGEASDSATLTVRGPPIWSLSDDERRAYLEYYSPIVFKRANEDGHELRGLDLVTNFDFDRDDVFSNNKRNWEQIYRFVDGDPNVEHWQIRPTLYSAIIEFMEEDGTKSVLLLYHIYHAMQKNSIHDWERVEIRIDDVEGTPGIPGEQINFVVITEHHDHRYRVYSNEDLNFMERGTGKHVLIWQAQWSGDPTETHNAELRFVEDSWRRTEQRVIDARKAEVEVNGDSEKKNINYVFVCECSSSAKNYWAARAINQENASERVAGIRDKVDWNEVQRVTYELQDIADILPTHTRGGGYEKHWTEPFHMILMDSQLLGIDGSTRIEVGYQDFFYRALDDQDPKEDRAGYPHKSWFWGAYDLGGDRDLKVEAYAGNADTFQGGTRGDASGHPGSHDAYWRQHDYFAHDGENGPKKHQYGRWLELDWYSAEKGGFDGRWVQLFED